jgi:hypothetical protein
VLIIFGNLSISSLSLLATSRLGSARLAQEEESSALNA